MPTGIPHRSYLIDYSDSLICDESYDVVVLGYGSAGAMAAIEAGQSNQRVLVLEKLPRAGGNTAVAGGGFIVPDDPDQAFTYLKATFDYAQDEMDEAGVRQFCEECVRLDETLKHINPKIEFQVLGHANYPQLEGAQSIQKLCVKGPKTFGANLFDALDEVIQSNPNICVRLSSPATALVHRNREVLGVCYSNGHEEKFVRANRAVILATGGYEFDKETLQNYCQGTQVLGLGCPGNTGDGLRFAQALGASLWHMRAYSCPLGTSVPGYQSAVLINMMTPGYIWVDQDGKRFVNEAGVDFHSGLYAVNHFDPIGHRYPAIPCWLIMDEEGRKSGTITHQNFGYISVAEGYNWSAHCEKEIASGLVKKASSIDELATITGLDSKTLTETISRWNQDIESLGYDTVFGRKKEKPASEKDTIKGLTSRKLSAPLKTPPYYALKLYPALLNTQGGPRRNTRMQVLDVSGQPIARLYATGELGSLWGCIYQGSSNIAEALISGRIAAQDACRLSLWH